MRLNIEMERLNSRKVSHHWAPLTHHSSCLLPHSLSPISSKFFQLVNVLQMCCSLAAAKQTGNCVIFANRFAFPSSPFPLFFFLLVSFGGYSHSFPSVNLHPPLPRCSLLPLPLQSKSTNYALCNPLKINVYGGGRNGNVDPATTPTTVTTLCCL